MHGHLPQLQSTCAGREKEWSRGKQQVTHRGAWHVARGSLACELALYGGIVRSFGEPCLSTGVPRARNEVGAWTDMPSQVQARCVADRQCGAGLSDLVYVNDAWGMGTLLEWVTAVCQ